MGESLAPDVDHRHEEGGGVGHEVEEGGGDDAGEEVVDAEEEEVGVVLFLEDLGLHFEEGDVGEVDVEDEAEVEFAHEEEGGERPPDLEVDEGLSEAVDEGVGGD